MIKIYIVDAFVTKQDFSGNPAGVCLLESWQPDSWMQNIAAEMNHAETAFVISNAATFSIRYFTPTIEVPLCGHATLAAAHVLWHEAIVSPYEDIHFHAKGGVLLAQQQTQDYIQLDFPAATAEHIQNFDKSILERLALNPVSIYQADRDIVYQLANEQAVQTYQPDVQLMQTLPFRMHIITAKSDQLGVNFVSRVFAPAAGIDEDSATGIAQCILAPLWAHKLQLNSLSTLQLSTRGAAFKLTLANNRVQLAGKTRLILQGNLYI
jgi:PhzF family phenazine biosynthesis protein